MKPSPLQLHNFKEKLNVVKGIIALREIHDKLIKKLDEVNSAINKKVGPKGEKGDKGDRGENAKMYSREEIVRMLSPYIPSAKDGKDAIITSSHIEMIVEKASKKIKLPKLNQEIDPMKIIDIVLNMPEGKKLTAKHIEGLEQTLSALNNQTKRGYLHGGGDTIKAGNNITITINSDGTKTISSTGGSGSGGSVVEIPSGAVDNSNVTFTFVNNLPQLLCINGLVYRQSGGAYTWTVSGMTITLSNPVGVNGSIFGISGTFVISEVSGTVDNSNTSFTSSIQPKYVNANGLVTFPTSILFPWAYSVGTLTTTYAVGANGSIFGISGINFVFDSNALVTGII